MRPQGGWILPQGGREAALQQQQRREARPRKRGPAVGTDAVCTSTGKKRKTGKDPQPVKVAAGGRTRGSGHPEKDPMDLYGWCLERPEDGKKRRRSTSSTSESEENWCGRSVANIKVLRKIGSGSYGDCYEGEVMGRRASTVCLKIENTQTVKSKLSKEYEFLKYIKQTVDLNDMRIPVVHELLVQPPHKILVLSMLGPSLEELFQFCDKRFDEYTVLHLGFEMMHVIEQIHSCGIVHRDVKPHNFLVGPITNRDRVFAIDFGLSKWYTDETEKHIEFCLDKNLVGTARYVSLNVHRGYEYGRRDDMESIGYMLLYFLRGRLPWQGHEPNKAKRNKRIHLIKEATPLAELCQGFSSCFERYLRYTRALEFQEKPDYGMLADWFALALKCDYGEGVSACDSTPNYIWQKRGYFRRH
ncbi:Casein kinase I isoform alpha [Diplonema papillatum]|nr:Casein kinase I isoform alpha [Diplonema papillatum]